MVLWCELFLIDKVFELKLQQGICKVTSYHISNRNHLWYTRASEKPSTHNRADF